MFTARRDSPSGSKVWAAKDLKGFCEGCEEELTPRCGDIVRWHWAHKSGSDCVHEDPDEFNEWRVNWLQHFDPTYVEVWRSHGGNRMRTDIQIDGVALKFQHSSLPLDRILLRENHFEAMVWMFNMSELIVDEEVFFETGRILVTKRKSTCTQVTKPMILDTPKGLFVPTGLRPYSHTKLKTPIVFEGHFAEPKALVSGDLLKAVVAIEINRPDQTNRLEGVAVPRSAICLRTGKEVDDYDLMMGGVSA